jgi:7-carboxy-7-deazaguanine synthase
MIANTMKLNVNEIFYSIQGESVHAGLPCIFVRLTGCNLRCSYCDTRYAFDEGEALTIDQMIGRVKTFGCSLVEITGGEPLLQDGTPVLVAELLEAGYTVLLETNGSLDIDRVDRRCSRIMDIKCPSSQAASSIDENNFQKLTANDQVKFVIGDREDFRFARRMLERLPDCLPTDRVLFSAVDGQLSPDRLARWMLEESIRARLQLQLHKVIWPDMERGV